MTYFQVFQWLFSKQIRLKQILLAERLLWSRSQLYMLVWYGRVSYLVFTSFNKFSNFLTKSWLNSMIKWLSSMTLGKIPFRCNESKAKAGSLGLSPQHLVVGFSFLAVLLIKAAFWFPPSVRCSRENKYDLKESQNIHNQFLLFHSETLSWFDADK